MYTTTFACAFDTLRLISDGQNLTQVCFSDDENYPHTAEEAPDLEIFKATKAWLTGYFNGERPALASLALKPAGTPFQQAAWQLLRQIPYGEVRTYGQLAAELGLIFGKEKMSAQAVGQAVSRNPLAIIVPCHRVVGANYNLTGYAGGLGRKIALLGGEGLIMDAYHTPKQKEVLHG